MNIKLTFTTKVNSYTGKYSTNFGIGDFNGDGLIDFVFASASPNLWINTTAVAKNPIHIMVQNLDGSFTEKTNTLAPYVADVTSIDDLETVDINHDGITDIIIANGGSNTSSGFAYDTGKIYISSSGQFQLQQTPSDKVTFWHYVNIGDVNCDGNLDLLFLTPISKAPSVLLINKSGALLDSPSLLPPALINNVQSLWTWNPAPGSLTTRQYGYAFQISELLDVNGDGYPDIVAFPHSGDSEFIFMNDGTGDFSKSIPIQMKVSFAGANAAYAYTDFAYNQSTRSWSPQMGYSSNYVFYDSIKMDVNSDGNEDIVAISTYDLSVTNIVTGAVNQTAFHQNTYIQILINNGKGLVDETGTRVQQPAIVNKDFSYYPYIYAVDLNNDGFKDFMLTTTTSVNPNVNQLGWTGQPDTIFYLNDGHGHFAQTTIPSLPNNQYLPGNVNGKLALIGITNYEYEQTGNKIISVWSTDQPWTTGTSGNDFLYSTPANDVINGSVGIDTFVASGKSREFTWTQNQSNNQFVIADKSGVDGSDTLIGVERIKFYDTSIALDISSTQTAGSGYMLYKAAFNRTPDVGGLGYWISKMDGGMSYSDVAKNFVTSAEFKTAFGGSNPSVNTLVTKLYNNVLNRTPDAGGLAFWQDKLNTGWSTADVLGFFSTSAENVTNVTPLIANGIQYQQFVG